MNTLERGRDGGESREGIVVLVPALPTSSPDSAPINVGELLNVVWLSRWAIFATFVLCILASIAYLLLADEWFRSETLLAPAEQSSLDGLRKELGGLAALAGFGVNESNASNAVATLRSRDLVRDFIEREDLLPILFADEWDSKAKQWRPIDQADWPDIRDGVAYFDENIRSVKEDRGTGLVTLAIEWTDPAVAAEWASELVQMTNERMRRRAIIESEANLSYLGKQMAATTIVELQRAIARLQEGELQKLMVAQGNNEFAFVTIDQAAVPREPSAPRVMVVLAVAIVAAVMIIVSLVISQLALQRYRRGRIAG